MLADELGSMSAALAASDSRVPAQTMVEEPTQPVVSVASGADDVSSSTSNFIYGFIAMAIFGFKLTTCAQRYMQEKSTQTHYQKVQFIDTGESETATPQTPVFGTKSEHFSLDQYMRVPKVKDK